jgi:iron complex transport system substrate-binding protein
MKPNEKIILLISITIIAVGVIGLFTDISSPTDNQKVQITDMIGHSAEIPAKVNKVASISSSVTVTLFMLVPDKLIGWNEKRSDEENLYMTSNYKNLPVIGGGKNDANYENIISMNPDVVLIGHGGTVDSVNEIQQKFGDIPTLDVEGDNNISNITPSISFVGNVTGEKQKASQLIELYNNLMQEVNNTVSTIPENEKKKVYYARDSSGLMSNPPGSTHTQLIEICGGKNVVEAPITKGSVGVSMELILKWNPDVIITSDPTFYKKVYSDSLWQNVNAVKDKQVYLVPNSPFNWFEGPPGANTILGIAWTAKVLYPDKFQNMDLKKITKDFYSEYYNYNLTDDQVSNILSSSGLKDY